LYEENHFGGTKMMISKIIEKKVTFYF